MKKIPNFVGELYLAIKLKPMNYVRNKNGLIQLL